MTRRILAFAARLDTLALCSPGLDHDVVFFKTPRTDAGRVDGIGLAELVDRLKATAIVFETDPPAGHEGDSASAVRIATGSGAVVSHIKRADWFEFYDVSSPADAVRAARRRWPWRAGSFAGEGGPAAAAAALIARAWGGR
jgi:hypothetical protein